MASIGEHTNHNFVSFIHPPMYLLNDFLLWIVEGSTDLVGILYSPIPCTRHSGDAPVPSAIFPGHTEYGQEKQ